MSSTATAPTSSPTRSVSLPPPSYRNTNSSVARRAAGEPLQYLTGHQEFWKADFLVTPAVLIPRPDN